MTPVLFLVLAQAHPTASHAVGQLGWEQIVQSNILNILIAAAALWFLIKRFNLLSILDQRREKIIRDIAEAEARREKALADLAEIEKRTAGLTREVQTLLNEAEKTATTMAQGILNQARLDADKLQEQALRRIEQEERSRARHLEQRLMAEALHAAQELLENTLTDDDRRRSVEDFVGALPALSAKTRLGKEH